MWSFNKQKSNKTRPQITRKFRSVLVTGHRKNRIPDVALVEQEIITSLSTVLAALGKHSKDVECRLLTGNESGADEWALCCAASTDVNWKQRIVIAPRRNDSNDADATARIYVEESSTQALPEQWVEIADNTKLHYADVVVAIWDGQPPKGSACGGGTVRLLREALRRRLPVIWIDARADRPGQVHLSRRLGMDEVDMMLIDAHDLDTNWLDKAFITEDASATDVKIQLWLPPFIALKPESELVDRLDYWDSDEQPVLAGWVYRAFIKVFAGDKKPLRPLKRAIKANRPIEEKTITDMNIPGYWDYFDRLDRAANRAANLYRDNVILLFLLSSLAVLGAVAGAIHLWSFSALWGVFEFATLFSIGLILYRDSKSNAHDSWLFYRQAAESFRLNFFLIEQLATLPEVHRGIIEYENKELKIRRPFHWLMLQVVRELGPLQRHEPFILSHAGPDAIGSFTKYLSGQKNYHETNGEKNEKAHHRLHRTTQIIFFTVGGIVLLHLFAFGVHWMEHTWHIHVSPWMVDFAEWIHHQEWFLLITAFFPALAASLHGIMTTLEFQRLAIASKKLEQKLEQFETAFMALNDKPENDKTDADRFLAQRGLVISAIKAMNEEHVAWAQLIDAQRMGIPA